MENLDGPSANSKNRSRARVAYADLSFGEFCQSRISKSFEIWLRVHCKNRGVIPAGRSQQQEIFDVSRAASLSSCICPISCQRKTSLHHIQSSDYNPALQSATSPISGRSFYRLSVALRGPLCPGLVNIDAMISACWLRLNAP